MVARKNIRCVTDANTRVPFKRKQITCGPKNNIQIRGESLRLKSRIQRVEKNTMKNMMRRLSPATVALVCVSFLTPLSHTVVAQNKSKVTVEVGQPNIWSLGQAHYLLSNMRERSRELGVKVPVPKELDPSSANGSRVNLLRTVVGADVGIDTVAGLQNSLLSQRFDADLSRFTANQARLDALTVPYTDAVREVANLTVQLAALPVDRPEFADQRKQLSAQLAAKTAERDGLKAEMDVLRQAVTSPSAPTTFKGTLPTNGPSPLPDDLKTLFDKFNQNVSTPQLNASTTLENYIQMQYEVIAKQLTLLRDEVGPGQRLVFLEMPMSLYTVPKADDDYVVRLEWDINRFYTTPKGEHCTNGGRGDQEGQHYGEAGFKGEAVNINVTEAPLEDVVKYISDQMKVGVVIDDSARGVKITTTVTNVPWKLALDRLLEEKGLGIEANDGVLRIAKLEVLQKAQEERKKREDQDRQEKHQIRKQSEPVTLDTLSAPVMTPKSFNENESELKCWIPADKKKFRVIDIIPRQSALNVNDQHGTQKGLALTAKFLTLFGLGGQVSFQRQRALYEQFIQQEVYASAYGKGTSGFGWTFGPLPGTKRLAPGVRTTYAVLSVPSDALAMELKVVARAYKRDVPLDSNKVKTLQLKDEGFGNGMYQLLIPNELTEGFWVDRVTYTPVEKGKQATMLIEGKYFSPLTGILVNGIPLKRAVSLAKNESSIANLLLVNAVDPAGEYEYLNPQQLILSFKMDPEYVGTPLITLVTPEKTSAINFYSLDEINFHFYDTSLAEVSEIEPMFSAAFSLGNVEVIDEDVNFVNVYLQGTGFRRGATFSIGSRPLDTARGEESEHISPTLYRLKFQRPDNGKAVTIRYRNTTRQAVQEGSVTFHQRILSNYEIIRYEPAQGRRAAMLELILTVTGQDAAPAVEIQRADGEVLDGPVALGNNRFRLRIAARRDPIPLMVTGVNHVTLIFDIGLPEAPSIARVVNTTTGKAEGPASKAAIVTLNGTNFRHVTRVLFGNKEATILQVDPQVILVNAPPGDEGPVQILLETNINLRGKTISNIADFRTQSKAIYTYTK
jgi:hypothetical protein